MMAAWLDRQDAWLGLDGGGKGSWSDMGVAWGGGKHIWRAWHMAAAAAGRRWEGRDGRGGGSMARTGCMASTQAYFLTLEPEYYSTSVCTYVCAKKQTTAPSLSPQIRPRCPTNSAVRTALQHSAQLPPCDSRNSGGNAQVPGVHGTGYVTPFGNLVILVP